VKLLLKHRLFPRTTIQKDQNPAPPFLFQMATAYWLSQAIYVAAKLGIADLLKDSPRSSAALAAATGSDASSLFRVLRALSSVGVFSQLDKDCFALSRLGDVLRSDVPGSLRAIVITIGEIHYQVVESFFTVFGLDLPPLTTCLEQACLTTCRKTLERRTCSIEA
jgi:hypothetical protein